MAVSGTALQAGCPSLTTKVILSGPSKLGGANLSEAFLRTTDFREADLSMANLYEADLRKADLNGANLFGAGLGQANLSDTNLFSRGRNRSQCSSTFRTSTTGCSNP